MIENYTQIMSLFKEVSNWICLSNCIYLNEIPLVEHMTTLGFKIYYNIICDINYMYFIHVLEKYILLMYTD